MSERFSKAGLSTGSSWHLFAENIAFEESDSVAARIPNSAETTRLHSEDAATFGICPARTFLQLITCKLCEKVLNAPALSKHYELKHTKFLSSVKPSLPKRCIPSLKPPHQLSNLSFSKSKVLKSGSGKQVIRIEEVDPNDKNVKIEEVPLTIPNFSSASSKSRLSKMMVKGIDTKNTTIQQTENLVGPGSSSSSSSQICIQVKGTTKKIPHLKEKEYDPDKHCGVWIPELDRNCTRSLTCKTHPLSLRRAVIGRCKDFDILLAEHRARVTLKAQENNATNSSASPKSNSKDLTPVNSPYGYDKIVFPSVPMQLTTNYKRDSTSSKAHKISPDLIHEKPVILNCISDDVKSSSTLPSLQRHPRPIKVNLFGSRQTECKCRVYSRRMDHFHNATASMLQRYKNKTVSRSKTSMKDTSKIESEGIYAALKDPLQNGIVYKQKHNNIVKNNKMLSNVGSKRHLSLNELQQQGGLITDGFAASSATKRRNSSVTDATLTSPNQYLNRSLSNPTESFDKLNKLNDVIKSTTSESAAKLLLRRSHSSVNSFLNTPFELTTSAGYIVNTRNNFTANCSYLPAAVSLSSNTNSAIVNSITVSSPQKPVQSDSLPHYTAGIDPSKTLSPAPNVTITQGMLVSLPAAMLQQNTSSTQQNMYTMGNQTKDLVTTCAVSTLSSPVVQSTVRQHGKKAYLLQQNPSNVTAIISPQPNGTCSARTPTTPVLPTQDYSIKLTTNSTDIQQLVPNITVTASHSLSGVLHGVTVYGGANTVNRLKSSTFQKSPNALLNDRCNQQVQHQLIMPVQSNSTNREQQPQKQAQFNSTQSPLAQQFSQQLQSNFTTLPMEVSAPTYVNNTPNITNIVANSNQQQQTVKQFRKLPLQQTAAQQQQIQQQIQNQHYITMHGGYQQQILPKLPTVPQVISQYHNQQFTPSQNSRNVQFIPQNNSTSTLQQQHGGALS